MTEIIAGALLLFGGGLMSASSLNGRRSSVERARELLGDSDAAVVRRLPPDMAEILARLD